MSRRVLVNRLDRHCSRLDIAGPKERVRLRLVSAGVLIEDRARHPGRWLKAAFVLLAGWSALCIGLYQFGVVTP